MGVRLHIVHFEQAPSIAAIKNSLLGLTGLALVFDEELDNFLRIQHPTRSKSKADLDWIDEENQECIRVWSETPSWNYIEVSALYLLRQLGGRAEQEYSFPIWAGRKWINVYPRNLTSKLKAWWNETLPE